MARAKVYPERSPKGSLARRAEARRRRLDSALDTSADRAFWQNKTQKGRPRKERPSCQLTVSQSEFDCRTKNKGLEPRIALPLIFFDIAILSIEIECSGIK